MLKNDRLKFKNTLNLKHFLCFTEILAALKICRETGSCADLPVFALLFVYLLFLAADSAGQKKNPLFNILETIFFLLILGLYKAIIPPVAVVIPIFAGIILQVFRLPDFNKDISIKDLIGSDYRSFSAYGAFALGTLTGLILPVETMMLLLTCVSAAQTVVTLIGNRNLKIALFGKQTVKDSFSTVRKSPLLMRATLGTSWIWAMSFLLLLNIVTIGSLWTLIFLLTTAAFAFWAGFSFTQRLSKHIVDLTFMPLNMAAMAISLAAMAFLSCFSFAPVSVFFTTAWMINAFSAGMYTFPMIMQLRFKIKEHNLQAATIIERLTDFAFFAIVLTVTSFRYASESPLAWIFIFTALVAAGILFYHRRVHPTAIRRSLVRILFEAMFNVTVKGQANFRQAGHRVLIIANHTSAIDALLVAAFMPERISVILPIENEGSLIAYVCRLFADVHILDIKDAMALRPIISLLKQNKKVLVFPERRSSVTGGLMKVYAGVGVVAEKANANILPICITGAQYSKFSLQKGLHKTKFFQKIRLTIMPSRKLVADHLDDKRKRNYSISLQLYRMMSEMMIEAFNSNRNIFKALLDAESVFGAKHEIAEDASRKTLNYSQLLLKSYVLGGTVARYLPDEDSVGVMMPNVLANLVLFYGLVASDKVPAMLNFSSGPAQILSCLKAVCVKTVITSHAFIEAGKLEGLEKAMKDGGIRLLYLEDIAKAMTAVDKIKGIFRRLIAAKPKRKANEAAAVLFTSGSEGMPKAVLLSHTNFLINGYQAVVEAMLTPRDIFFNALPMFHSFGLGVGCILTTINGIKTVLYPSPLHYRVIPELIYDTNSTILCATDTFLAGYGNAAHPYDFFSLRMAVVGAEKLKESTEKLYLEKFCLRIMEGYGATECSPLISVNTRMYAKRGSVGRIVPALEYKLDPVEGITDGKKLVVRGKNVMMGYMRADNPGVLDAPKDGWYDTGDIVEVDDEDFIFIKGRAKRFAKVGGEMISLTAIETAINELYPETGNAIVAVADEKKGEKLVLFTTCQTAESAAVKAFIRQKGLSDLGAPSQIVIKDEIPVIGSGKTDYVLLKKMAEEL